MPRPAPPSSRRCDSTTSSAASRSRASTRALCCPRAVRPELAFRLLILRRLPDDVEQAVKGADARGILVNGSAVAGRPEVVEEMHDLGLRVVVYTLNDDVEWEDTIAAGVDGIVTDEPVRLREWQDTIARSDG